jgi:hypothetical protein
MLSPYLTRINLLLFSLPSFQSSDGIYALVYPSSKDVAHNKPILHLWKGQDISSLGGGGGEGSADGVLDDDIRTLLSTFTYLRGMEEEDAYKSYDIRIEKEGEETMEWRDAFHEGL